MIKFLTNFLKGLISLLKFCGILLLFSVAVSSVLLKIYEWNKGINLSLVDVLNKVYIINFFNDHFYVIALILALINIIGIAIRAFVGKRNFSKILNSIGLRYNSFFHFIFSKFIWRYHVSKIIFLFGTLISLNIHYSSALDSSTHWMLLEIAALLFIFLILPIFLLQRLLFILQASRRAGRRRTVVDSQGD